MLFGLVNTVYTRPDLNDATYNVKNKLVWDHFSRYTNTNIQITIFNSTLVEEQNTWHLTLCNTIIVTRTVSQITRDTSVRHK